MKQNPETVPNCLRNKRALKAQKKQMNAISSKNNALHFVILLYMIKMAYKKKLNPTSIQTNKFIIEIPGEKLKHRFNSDMIF